MESDYTLLPFYSTATTARLIIATFLVLITVIAIKAIFFNVSISCRKAPATVFFAYITAAAANVMFCTFLYWYWALPFSLIISLVFAFTTARDVREANSEERIGVWGLNKNIRRIRGELFNDMTVEEQLEYSRSVKETKFSKLLFILVTMAVPAIAVVIFHSLDIGYLFFPVYVG